jgi:ATP-binding cassette, subfamily B, multidrug efflux pump
MKLNDQPTAKFGPFNLDLLPALNIEHISLEFETEISHFWGENGVGKSTVMNLVLNQLLEKNVTFSYVNQNYRQNWLWWYSIEQNLILAAGLKSSIELYNLPQVKDQWHWLEKIVKSKPKNVDFSREDEISSVNLSGGQLQRLTLFREILRKPSYFLLDEVFSALDKDVSTKLIEWLLLEQKKYGFKIIAISHDTEILRQLPGQVFDFEKDSKANLKVKKRL